MLLRNITFEDYRPYKDTNTIDVSIDYTTGRNVVLIGGLNGAGKTSILDGIKLALYGDKSGLLGGESYSQFIKENINKKSFREGKRKFRISLEFEKERVGISTITICREWFLNNDGTYRKENLSILENGNPREDLEDEQDKDEYIQALVPVGVSQFFFFDAEKIQYMADDEGNEDALIKAIKDILNINIYSLLEDDLVEYERRQKYDQVTTKDSDLKQVEYEIQKAKEDLEESKTKYEERKIELEETESQIAVILKWLRKQGHGGTQKRADIQEELEVMEDKKSELGEAITAFLEDTLPYLILGPRIQELLGQLEKEDMYKTVTVKLEQREKDFKELVSVLEDKDILPPLTFTQKAALTNKLALRWDQLSGIIEGFDITNFHPLHHTLANHEYDQLKHQIETLIKGDYSSIERIVKEYDDVIYRVTKLRQELKKIPADSTIAEKELELQGLREDRKPALAKALENERAQQDHLTKDIESLTKKYDDILDKIKLSKRVQRKIDESKKIRNVLGEFINKLAEQKAKDVEWYLTDMFSRVARKKDLIRAFKIDPDSFEVMCENFQGEVLPKRTMLSSGERQIYAISLVWALAMASQKPLPIVIDTPLGRLDSDHKLNIVTKYFTEAGKQVIVLSTDEEVAYQRRELLLGHIAKEYLVTTIDSEEAKIEPGYF